MVTKPKNNFQSYLILGDEQATQKEVEKLAGIFGVKLALNSPDISIVRPQTSHISIDQIREIKKSIYQKPILSKFKFIIIKGAQNLTMEAQNALLKILEEPPVHALIFLEAFEKVSLLPTIISRVKIIRTLSEKNEEIPESDLATSDILALFDQIAQVDDPARWLDEQIVAQHDLLTRTITGARRLVPAAKISKTIEKCIEAKKMLDANVNPKFVLFNLIISLNQ